MATREKPAPGRRPRPGLGRGLGALIGTATAADAGGEGAPAAATAPGPPGAPAEADAARRVVMIPVAEVVRGPWQPRQVFESAALQELTDSIRTHGVIQPLLCRRRPGAAGYELIAGERRLRAAGEAGLTEVPAIVVDAADREAAEMAIVENIQREDLNAIEEAEGYRVLLETFSLTQQEVAERVGKARASVANALRLLELPEEVKQLVGANLLSAGHAKVLLSLADAAEQVLLARRCVTAGLTVRALERTIRRRAAERAADGAGQSADMPESHRRYLLDRLQAHFGTQVRLQPSVTRADGRRTKGCIEIDFHDNDDLTRLLGLMGVDVE
jgi:ParB family chromosome partitioning protein